MDYINYLYESVYFWDKISKHIAGEIPRLISQEKLDEIGITQGVYNAVMRTLVIYNMIDYDENYYILTDVHLKEQKRILKNIISEKQKNHYELLYAKAVNKDQYFFNSISDLEYEIYSRYNYGVTFEVGMKVSEHINFNHHSVLELGGNSGGLGTAVMENNIDCQYSVVDLRIPCMVGNEFKEINNSNINFIENNIFELILPEKIYDFIVIMNLLHDFDDVHCLKVLKNCKKYCCTNTKFVVIEDILFSEFKPTEVIMHGVRLSIECRGGIQRTMEGFKQLFSEVGYKLEKIIRLNEVHSMLVFNCV